MACCDEVSSLQPATLCALLATRPVTPLVGSVFNAFDPVTCTINEVTLPTFVETTWVGVEGVAIDIVPGGTAGHSPTIGVRISTDAFNNVTLGTDGGLYVAPSVPGPQTPITVNDTCSINLTASGLDNHTLQADVNVSIGSNPFPCGPNGGAPIYCSPTGLRTMPPNPSSIHGRFNGPGVNGVVGPGGFVDDIISVFITNPSTCRDSRFMAGGEYGTSGSYNDGLGGASPGVTMTGNILFTVGGGGLAGPFQVALFNPQSQGVPGYNNQMQQGTDDVGAVAAGGAFIYTIISRTQLTFGIVAGTVGSTTALSILQVTT